MRGEEGVELVTGPWDAFALTAVAPLGPFVHVHLAPKIPPGLLNNALQTYLPLQKDELILALIDRGVRAPGNCCALTMRRIYWEETRDRMSRGLRPAALRARDRGPVVLFARYGDLPKIIPNSKDQDGSVRLELPGDRAIVLKGVDKRLGEALARFLERMGEADRLGIVPPGGEVDPALAARIRRVLPVVAELTAQGRAHSQDLHQFRSALQSASTRPVATPVFIVACIAVFAVMVASGVPVFGPSAVQLRDWGANDGSRVVLRGEYWRLITGVFIHGGLIHLAVNMWSLLVIGPLVERLYGNMAFAIVYLAAGVGGAIASIAAFPGRTGVGASGAICGLLGALVAFLITHRRSIPASLLKSLGSNVLGVIIFMVILGRIVPNIDQEAHFGGLAVGFLSGLLLYRPWPVVRGLWTAARRVMGALLIAAGLAAAAYGMTHRAIGALPPANRLSEIRAQLVPALDELNAINDKLPSSLALKRDREDPESRGQHLQAIDELSRRAAGNRKRLDRAWSPYPRLHNMAGALVQAQARQISALDAARRYLDTGDLSNLNGPDGFLKMKTAYQRALQSFQQQQVEYMCASDMIRVPEPPTYPNRRGPD